ncbi:MAG: sigma-54 dependent transcriptional regulator, partial [Candidatus Poribacteria bacterium]|nr:sigma-54 dependent transcriptional regulator [Candidatus Poribacteria bacterium]
MKNVLIVDDDEKICWAFEQFLESEGFYPSIANNAEEGLRKIQAEQPDIIFLDVRLPGMNGLEALEQIKELQSNAPVVIMTAYDDVETTIEAMRLQAFDFLPKPIDLDAVKEILHRASKTQTERRKITDGTTSTPSADPSQHGSGTQEHRLVGKSEQMREIYKLIGVMASNTITVLIEGDTGTGKELVAQAIHVNSARKDGPFISVNCGALPDELLESELFGYEAGAFTGAKAKGKPGRFEIAGGGTLFLDEVSNMSPALQIKLQRALQEQEIERLGGTRTLKTNVRVLAATNQDLAEMAKLGLFRQDLYYRFKRLAIHLPPLRERTEDITLLVDHFLKLISAELGKTITGVSDDCLGMLEGYDWPGNVRELENALRSAAVLSRSDVILPEHLPPDIVNFERRSESNRALLEQSL